MKHAVESRLLWAYNLHFFLESALALKDDEEVKEEMLTKLTA